MPLELPYKWQPRTYQIPLWHHLINGGTRASAVWHRRAGKDELCLHWAACAAHMRVGNYWHMLPQAKQARKALWDAVNPHTGIRRIDEAFPEQLRANTRDQEMMIRFKNGSTWQVLGSDNYNALVGSPPIGLVFSEWALADPSAWAFLRPIMLENRGWALFIGTPRGHNHAKRTHDNATTQDNPHWFGELLTVDDTHLFDPDQLEMERAELHSQYGEELGEALFQQEYYCSFNAALPGAYFVGEIRKMREDGRVGSHVKHVKGLPVHTWWDLGVDDPTAIVFVQFDGPRVLVIDYFQSNGAGMVDYIEVLMEKKREHKYQYGAHVGPHDIENREKWSAKSLRKLAEEKGIRFRRAPKLRKLESIHYIRDMLPRTWMNSDTCGTLISALEQHHCEYDEKTRTMGLNPVHDWTSHPVDAFKTGAQSPIHFFTSAWEDTLGNPSKFREIKYPERRVV